MTHCALLLEVLADGQPHDHLSLYRLGMIVHSRVSELRKRGYRIDMWRDGDLYIYRLTGSPLSESAPLSPPRAHRDAGDRPPAEVGADWLSDQLTLTEVVAP